MSGPLLVTGATGLVGANVCRLATERGRAVRALVRRGSDPAGLPELGVEVVEGDVTSADEVRAAVDGAGAVVHTAALVAGIRAPEGLEESERVNVGGTVNVLDAAAAAHLRAVVFSTIGILPFDQTIDEVIAPSAPMDGEIPYMTTKRRAFDEAMTRARGGQEVMVIFPGGVYGPSPCVRRSLAPSSFNAEVQEALRGTVERFPALELPWVLAHDVAAVALAALEHGTAGSRYMATGRNEDVMTVPAFLSLACELAGAEHRVATVQAGDPGAEAFGMMVAAAEMCGIKGPAFFDASRTRDALGVASTPVRQGLAATVAWMEQQRVL